MVQLCNRLHFEDGVWHKCGLPVERFDPAIVHIHICGLPSMTLPLDKVGTCRFGWMSDEERKKLNPKGAH